MKSGAVKTIPLGELVTFEGGGTPSKANAEYWNGDIPWASVKDITSLELSRTTDAITAEGLRNSASRIVPKGNVIIPTRMALGRAAINTVDVAINQDLRAAYPSSNLDRRFLLWFIIANARLIDSLGSGATVKGITLEKLRELPVPLPHKNGKPDLEEQKRIAAILDKADGIRRKRQQALRLTDDFLRSVFLDMFGDPVTNPMGWETVDLGKITEQLTGFAFKSSGYVVSGEGIRLCRGANVLPGRTDWSNRVDWPSNQAGDFTKFELAEGDITIAMDRPWISTGFKMAKIEAKDLPALLVQRVARIRAVQPFTNQFLYALLSTEAFTRHCCPTETLVPHISPLELRNYPTIKPDEKLIKLFSKISDRAEAKRIKMAKSQSQAEDLFASLQQRAFRGEL